MSRESEEIGANWAVNASAAMPQGEMVPQAPSPTLTQEIGNGAIQTRKRRATGRVPTIEAPPSVSPIGQAFESDRQHGAIRLAITETGLPHAAPIEPTETPARRRMAKKVAITRAVAPSVAPNGSGNGTGGEGQSYADNHAFGALSAEIAGQSVRDDPGRAAGNWESNWIEPYETPVALLPVIADIVELQKQRVFCIKSQSRSDRSCESFIARSLGYRSDLPEKERKAIFARAASMRRAVEKGRHEWHESHRVTALDADGDGQLVPDNHTSSATSVCTPIILNSAMARKAWDNHRAQVEKQMIRLARTLPVHEWQTNVAGFGDLGLAIIVGEAGDIGSYATKERVWKRLGLAVIEGERQQRKSNAEQAAAHGYNPRRRAEIWTISDSMFKHQWRGAKEENPAHAVGPYGNVYAKRKTHTETREWTDGHRDNDARRVMLKALVEDVWRVWRGLLPNATQ